VRDFKSLKDKLRKNRIQSFQNLSLKDRLFWALSFSYFWQRFLDSEGKKINEKIRKGERNILENKKCKE